MLFYVNKVLDNRAPLSCFQSLKTQTVTIIITDIPLFKGHFELKTLTTHTTGSILDTSVGNFPEVTEGEKAQKPRHDC